MTQKNPTRPQGLNRIDPALREVAMELGVVSQENRALHAQALRRVFAMWRRGPS